MPKFKCCICGKCFTGFGNNPDPIVMDQDSLCCDDCNSEVVIPARIELIETAKHKILNKNGRDLHE